MTLRSSSPLRYPRPRSAPAAAWARSPVLLVLCVLLLLASPAGQATTLGFHVTVAEHESPPLPPAARLLPPHAVAPPPEPAPAPVRHSHGGHEHAHVPHPAPAPKAEAVAPPIPSSAPHEHDGVVHTHDPTSSHDPASPQTETHFEFYLAGFPGRLHLPPAGLSRVPESPGRPVESANAPDPPPPRG